MPYVPTTAPASATAAAHALATQAENYRRAVAAGVPHDLAEARSLVATARTLLTLVEEIPADTHADRRRTGDLS